MHTTSYVDFIEDKISPTGELTVTYAVAYRNNVASKNRYPASRIFIYILTNDIELNSNYIKELINFKQLLNDCCKVELDDYVYRTKAGRPPGEATDFKTDLNI